MSKHERVDREDQSRERLHRLVGEAQEGDEWAKQELMRVMRPMILGQVNKINTEDMYNYDQAKSELIQAGYVGVMEAINRFDPDRESSSFWSLAYFRIRHEVMEWLARNAGGIPMPRSAHRRLWHVKKAERKGEDHDVNDADKVKRADKSSLPIFEASELPDSVRDDEDPEYIIDFVNYLATVDEDKRLLEARRFVVEMGWKPEVADRMVKVINSETSD